MSGIPRLILASGSSARHAILKNASVAFTVMPADIDEDAVRTSLLGTDQPIDPADLAEVLAQAKGTSVSAVNPGSLIIAADQILVCDDEIFTKPSDETAARETLMKLRGKTHQLHSAVVIARDGEVVWSQVETANLTMRKFSATFIAEYTLRTGSSVCDSVGAYKLEGMGIQLFDAIDGDYFTILGLPLLPLLAKLRELGALTS
ncbi:MAG: Maf family protein [Pseudomonadota bacterium]